MALENKGEIMSHSSLLHGQYRDGTLKDVATVRETAHNIMTLGVKLKFQGRFLVIEILRQETRVGSDKENYQKVNDFFIDVLYPFELSSEFSSPGDILAVGTK